MPDEDRLRIYLDTLYEAQPAYLESLESEALSGGVPIIRKDTQRTLRTLLAMKKPEKIRDHIIERRRKQKMRKRGNL